MKHKYYVLCGENGLMIKAGYHKYPKVLEMLNTYLKGNASSRDAALWSKHKTTPVTMPHDRTPLYSSTLRPFLIR